jgi:hypothetical protein
MERALGNGEHLTRVELGAHLERAGLPGKLTHLAHIAMYAELEGVICSGPRRGKQSTYGLIANRAPNARRLPRDEAMDELARRFLQSHGPATPRDFSWWSGLPAAEAKRAFEMVRPRAVELDGLRYWTLGRRATTRNGRGPSAHLLPIYDEYLIAYRDREAVPFGASLVKELKGGYGSFQHSIVIDGQVAGTWRTASTGRGDPVQLIPSRTFRGAETAALRLAVGRYTAFWETLRTKRIPSAGIVPLSRRERGQG